jgi:hypothetical protein
MMVDFMNKYGNPGSEPFASDRSRKKYLLFLTLSPTLVIQFVTQELVHKTNIPYR